MDHYILKGRKPVKAKSLLEAVKWYDDFDNRQLATMNVGPFKVSTVFLMFDHSMTPGRGEPVLFETMVFCDDPDDTDLTQTRYTSFAAAMEGHNQIVDQLKQNQEQLRKLDHGLKDNNH